MYDRKEYWKKYYLKNKDKIKEYKKEWLTKNPNYNKKYHNLHKKELKEKKRVYYQKTKKHWIEKAREYRKNPEYRIKDIFYRMKYRYGITKEEYLNIIKNGCIICGINDIVDIHHKDGNWHNNHKENIVCLCSKCHTLLHKRVELNTLKKLMNYFIN